VEPVGAVVTMWRIIVIIPLESFHHPIEDELAPNMRREEDDGGILNI